MKAILKKSVKDSFWNYEDYDALTPNPITRALTNRYLPAWDPSPSPSENGRFGVYHIG